jgi:carboxypeptidase PM20D1
MLEGSPKDNVLPSTAMARINYRLAAGDSVDSVINRAREVTKGLDVTLEWEGNPTPASTISSTDSMGYRTMAALNQDLFKAPTAPSIMIGGTDGRKFEGIAKDVYRYLPIELSLTDTAMYHGQNEHIGVDALAKIAKFYGRLINTTAMQ